MSAVRCEGLTHTYGDRPALNGVGFEVEEESIVGLLGPNGGGKTTLFKILCTLLRPTSGSVDVLGLDALAHPADVRASIGVVFQQPSVDDKLTVEENLMHQGHLYGIRGRHLTQRLDAAMDLLRLGDRRRDLAETLSGGLKRRVDLAKGLLHDPQLLILDEPSTGLDPGIRREFWHDLERLRKERGMTVLLTTHLMEEADRCDRVVILDAGRIVADAAPGELTAGLGHDVVRMRSSDAEGLLSALKQENGLDPELLEGEVVLTCEDGNRVMRQLMEGYRDRIDSVTLGRPTLEDVFLTRTGHAFDGGADRE